MNTITIKFADYQKTYNVPYAVARSIEVLVQRIADSADKENRFLADYINEVNTNGKE